jgi:hypothetical protein
VHRVSGIAREALAVDLRESWAALAELRQARRDAAAAAEPVSDILYALVPALDDRQELRRKVLALRRGIHNGRVRGISGELLGDLAACLTEADAALVTGHDRALRRLQATEERFADEFDRDVAAAGLSLGRLLDHPALAAGLAHASPDLLRHLKPGSLGPGTKATRGLLSYASRAIVKTSPFSRFTALALDGARADGSSVTAITQQQVRRWLDRLARDEEYAGAFQVEPNRTARQIDGHPYLLVSAERSGTELAWRSDTLTDARLYQASVDALAGWPRLPVPQFLTRLGGSDPFATYLRLLDADLIRVVAPWRYADQVPLRALAAALDTVGRPRPSAAARALRSANERATALAGQPGRARVRAMAQLLDPGTLPAPAGSGQDGQPAVYEDAVSDIAVDLPKPPVHDDLRELGSLMRPFIFRTHLYDWIVECFVERFGPGGHTRDGMGFLLELAARPDFGRAIGTALFADRALFGQASERAWLPVSASSAPPTSAVLYQLSAGDRGQLAEGRYRLVVNQFNSGVGGLVARFRHLLDGAGQDGDGQAGLTDGLRRWAAELFPRAEPREVALCADINSMHLAASGILPPLPWPGETPCTQSPPGPSSLEIRHLPESGTLLLTDSRGASLAPVYLGIVPSHIITGAARLLLCLADPWVNAGFHLCCTPHTFGPPPGPGVHAWPRRVHGRLVLNRRTWRLRPEEFPRPDAGEGVRDFFLRMDEWRCRHGLPEEVFLTLEQERSLDDLTAHKPAWLSFRSPHSVLASAGTARLDQVQAVRLTEALPAAGGHWLTNAADGHRATEHASFLRWDRP